MEPFYTDYAGDYPDDWSGAASANEESSCPVAEEVVMGVVSGMVAVVGGFCDALGLLPGTRWMDGGP